MLVGGDSLPGVTRLRGFLTRNGVPHMLLDPAADADARVFIERYAPAPDELPLVICADGTMLRNPTEVELARCIGMVDAEAIQHEYDVAIVGAGPAGLAAAVYAASEGLSVVVLDARAFGGQAGASARIENYFGFPTGISGLALTARAYNQAQKFGARILIPAEVATMTCDVESRHFTLSLADGTRIGSRTVVVASGARYRRPPARARRVGRARFWALAHRGEDVRRAEVVLVEAEIRRTGGRVPFGTAKVWMLVRSQGLAASMSKYLIDRSTQRPISNCSPERRSSPPAARLRPLASVTWRHRDTEQETTRAIRHVFFPWRRAEHRMARRLRRTDAPGFVKTGGAAGRQSLETSVPGVFAIGDALGSTSAWAQPSAKAPMSCRRFTRTWLGIPPSRPARPDAAGLSNESARGCRWNATARVGHARFFCRRSHSCAEKVQHGQAPSMEDSCARIPQSRPPAIP